MGSWTFFQGRIPLLKHAYLWVISFPIEFIPGSISYLYVKSVLAKRKKLNKWDFIHFIPALLHFIELIPFYLLPTQKKQLSLTSYLLHPEKLSKGSVFIFPMNVHLILKTVLWLFYILLMFNLLIKFRKKNALWIAKNNHIWFWITKFTTIHAVAFIILVTILIFFDKSIYRQVSVMHLVSFILICIIILLFKPKILYGLNHSYNDNNSIQLKEEKEEKEMLLRSFELSPIKSKEYKEKVESLLYNEKAYLKKNYLLKDMSNDLDIPLHHLSYVINKEFGTNYTSLINNCRIEYIIEHRYDDAWSQFSLEGIGNEAGFNSKNTFFKTFKIITGKTPTEYFKKNEDNGSTFRK